MPNTRKKVIKTVYKTEEDSDNEGHDFSDSGSEAVITDSESSEEEDYQQSSDDDFQSETFTKKRQSSSSKVRRKPKSCKNKINKLCSGNISSLGDTPLFSIKNLTDADKLLPSILNLSESDSSDDESPKAVSKSNIQAAFAITQVNEPDNNTDTFEYKDVWSENIQDNSEEIAKQTFKELELQNTKIEETKISIKNYSIKSLENAESDVKDLLALGEDETVEPKENTKRKIIKEDSDSEMEDWEEVKDVKGIPQQGLQLIVGIPDGVSRKTKKLDIAMMMKRKMNRVKKEHQVYIHKVHVLCWLGHGNYVSKVLNDQEILTAALSLVPSKDCYPGERVDVKYVEQITTWYKDKITLVQDKNENKFKPKAQPLKELLLKQIKSKVFSTKKYMAFVFISMLRSLGLQCRVMFNFVTLPIRPPSSELCSLSTNSKDNKPTKNETVGQETKTPLKTSAKTNRTKKKNIPQVDGNYESSCESDNIMQVDGNDDNTIVQTRRQKNIAANNAKKHLNTETNLDEGVSPPKRAKRNIDKLSQDKKEDVVKKNNQSMSKQKDFKIDLESSRTSHTYLSSKTQTNEKEIKNEKQNQCNVELNNQPSPRKTRSKDEKNLAGTQMPKPKTVRKTSNKPKIVISVKNDVSSKYFKDTNDKEFNEEIKQPQRKRSHTSEPKKNDNTDSIQNKTKRARSAHIRESESEYFTNKEIVKKTTRATKQNVSTDKKRVSHRDLAMNKTKKNDVTGDLVKIIKGRVKAAKEEEKNATVKGKIKTDSDEDSDHLPVKSKRRKKSESDDDFKPTKLSPKPLSNLKKIDRRVLSTEDDVPLHKVDVWCEVFVEELEEWVAVDIIKGKVHCANEIYNKATHPVNYVVGWDNNNYLKDLTRRYVPHWNTVTRKQRVEPSWWNGAVKAWLGPKTAKDKEEDERLDRMQLEAPLPKSIAEYKNHPLYALKRHLLKFEAIYPPDAATLGFVRGEAVYARDCVYVCRSRDTWLKEAKVVRLGEQPYKIVKARPKWDKLSNKLITDKPLEVFGPWQVQDYEPPVAENGVVPRNPYGNVELFKDCMLPKGTVHIKLPGLNRVAKKLNIDCAPAMTGFEFNGGWSHPVYDGFVVCKEFETVITEAWLEDQEEQERKEIEKTEARVYGNWRRLIRGLFIKERLKAKYGFEAPSTSQDKKKTGPRLVVKKK